MTSLAVDSLTVRKGSAVLIARISFAEKGGNFIGVVGPNGAGKSTLLRAIAGLERAAEGEVRLDGADIREFPPQDRARRLAYLPQARETHWAIDAETVASLGRFSYGAPHRLGPLDRAAVERALRTADALAFRDRIMPTLSGGEQARVHLARALAAETPILLADEPTAALDLRHALAILAALRAKADDGGLVIAALHDLDLARRFCTRMIVLDAGKVVADGAPRSALDEALIARVFGVFLTPEGPALSTGGAESPTSPRASPS
jgi:iron complex transport system ATP-binding protein